MQTRTLGLTDLRLSEIALGTWGLTSGVYGEVAERRVEATLQRAIESGVTTFDVSPVWGESERLLGAALAEAPDDFEPVVITRGGARLVDGELELSFGADELVRDVDGSLERLGREHVDLWLLHNPGDVTLQKADWREAIHRLEEDGKIRAWGVSVGEVEEARVAIDQGAQALCLTYNLLHTRALEDLVDDLKAAGCGVLARSPLMYGLLAGHWPASRHFADDDHRGRRWGHEAFEARVRQVAAMRFLVGKKHPDMATAALRFVLSHASVTCALLGARSPYQVDVAADAASGPPYIDDEDMARLSKVRDAAGV
jgi:aryl-alcohol dehydrogenase-like predicted oxidoreductase